MKYFSVKDIAFSSALDCIEMKNQRHNQLKLDLAAAKEHHASELKEAQQMGTQFTEKAMSEARMTAKVSAEKIINHLYNK